VSEATAVKTNDRERMAEDLNGLGLYATSNDVRRGRSPLTNGVAHVRDYCLPGLLGHIERQRAWIVKYPPIPGTWGAVELPRMEARRDELQAFLDAWWTYDIAEIFRLPDTTKEGTTDAA
jgi:hypothetical protein